MEPEQVDAGLFERLLAEASGIGEDRPRAAGEILDQALSLWRGPALVEFADEPFAAAEAARLDELRLVAMERRFDVDLAVGAHAELVGQLRAFTALHPLRERPRGQLMLALYRCGRQAEALEAFTAYRHLLEDELGLEPSERLARAAGGDPPTGGRARLQPPAPAEELDGGASDLLDRGPGLRRRRATSFVGRADDIAAAVARIGEARLVTLTGIGGVGKTRLAAASRRRGVRPVRRWCLVVRAGPAHRPGSSRPGAGHVARRPPSTRCRRRRLDRRRSSLAKRLLLVLDNCEHVLDGVRPLVEAILRGCPRVVVLATSRERLGIHGERVQPVAPLPLPDSGRPLDVTAPAVALFVDRARAVRPDLQLGAANLAAIVGVCRHLDGLPLSLELAAARIRSLNPADLSARMAGHLDLLSPTGPDAGRHSTLRGVLDWSYDLLTPTQRRLFDRLSVFSGTFDLAAAEAVGSGDGIDRGQVVDLLTSLVDASMVTVGATEGRVRYSLLETLRAYGWSHLGHQDEADDRAPAGTPATSHRSPNRPTSGCAGPDEAAWVTIIDRELGNLRAAHQWLVRHGAGGAGAAPLPRAALLHAVQVPRRGRLLGPGDPRASWRGAASAVRRGVWRRRRGPDGARGDGLARALADRALTQVDGPDDERRMFGLRLSGMVALYVGRLDDGFRDHAEMLRLARLHDHPYEAGMALLGLAQSRTYAGAPDRGPGLRRGAEPRGPAAGQPVDARPRLVRPGRGTVHARPGPGDRAVPASHRSRRLGGGHLRRGNRPRRPGLAARTLGRPRHRSPAVPVPSSIVGARWGSGRTSGPRCATWSSCSSG